MSDKGKSRIPRGNSTEFNPKKKTKGIPYGTNDYLVSTALMRQDAFIENEEEESTINSAEASESTNASNSVSATTSASKSSKKTSNSKSSSKKDKSKSKPKRKSKKSKRKNRSRSSDSSSSDDSNRDNSSESTGEDSTESQNIHEDDLSSDDHTFSKKSKDKKDSPLQYFEKSNEKYHYKCKICEQAGNQKFIKMKYSNDSGLRKHLGSVHQMTSMLYGSQLRQRKKEQSPEDLLDTLGNNNSNLLAENSTSLKLTKERKKELDQIAFNCIIEDGRSFGDLWKPGILKFIKAIVPGYLPPKKGKIANKIRTAYQKHRSKLKKVLKHIDHISLTTDLWKNRKNMYHVGITGHFFDKNHKFHSFQFGFRRIFGRHFAKRIKAYIQYEIKRLEIEGKIVSITTDNANDIKKATSNGFGERISCAAHNLNLVVKNALPLWGKLTNKERNELKQLKDGLCTSDVEEVEDVDEFDSEYEDEVIDDTNDIESISDQEEQFDVNESSAFESDEGEIQDDASSQIESTQELNATQLIGKIKIILQKARSFIKLTNKSNVIFSYLRCLLLKDKVNLPALALDMPIRWNSTYLMIKNFLKYKKYVDVVTKFPKMIEKIETKMVTKLEKMSFSQLDWDLLELLQGVLHIFHLATVLISARKYATLSIAYFVQANIEYFLSKASNGKNTIYQDILKNKLNEEYQKFFNQKINKTQKEKTLIAAFLDPATFGEILDSEQAEALKLSLNEFKKYCEAYNLGGVQSNDDEKSNALLAKENASDLNGMSELSAMSGRKFKKNPKTLTLNEELAAYSSSNKNDVQGNPLKFEVFWQLNASSYPRLARFACYSNVIVATSVPSESSFSVAGHILRKERSRLSSKNLTYTMILKDAPALDELCSLYDVKE